MSDAVAEWFLQERGIARETLRHFNVGVRGDGAVVLPYPNGEKIRKGIPHGEREFFFTSGRKPDLFNQEEADRSSVALVEGETDAMRLWHEVNSNGGNEDNRVGVVGLSGIETWRDDFTPLFTASNVYVILDNDRDYNVQGRVDTAWRSIRASLGAKAKRVRLPGDVKDVCEFFANGYTLENLRSLMQSSPSQSRWKPLDLTQEPPPVDWLVDNLIVRGGSHLLMGEPSVGKSWLTMALCLGVVRGTEWLGQSVSEPGRVLYVDEENAGVLVFDRLRSKLGMTDEEARNVRYLSNQGIFLDNDPDGLVDEALDYGPSLIILDSLTRFHMGEEDKAGPMARLYNTALKPLARETGAALVVIHHAGKTDSTSSYRRSRGSGEIIANMDVGFDVRQNGINALTMAMFRSRFRQAGDVIHVAIQDTPEGGVRLVGGVTPDPPF
jgi:hypothetical protein